MMVAGVAAAILMVVGAGSAARAQGMVEVRMEGIAFAPMAISVPAGTTVMWTNFDPVIHAVAADNGAFASDLFGEGESFSFTFTTPGVYTYYCPPHPTMIGSVEVTG